MFNDFHETTRNVGIVGMLLGLLVVAGLCGLGMAVVSGMSESSGSRPSLEGMIESKEREIRYLKENRKKKEQELSTYLGFQDTKKTLDKATADANSLTQSVAGLTQSIVRVNKAIEEERNDFINYREEYRKSERAAAVGERIDLSETKGEAYKDVEIVGVTALHLRVRSSAIAEGIPFAELPQKVQDRFQFGNEEAAKLQQKINTQASLRAKKMAEYNENQKAKQAERNRAEMEKQLRQAQAGIINSRNLVARKEAEASVAERNAQRLEQEYRDALRAGRRTMGPAKVREERNKAKAARQSALRAEREAVRLTQLVAELQAKLGITPE